MATHHESRRAHTLTHSNPAVPQHRHGTRFHQVEACVHRTALSGSPELGPLLAFHVSVSGSESGFAVLQSVSSELRHATSLPFPAHPVKRIILLIPAAAPTVEAIIADVATRLKIVLVAKKADVCAPRDRIRLTDVRVTEIRVPTVLTVLRGVTALRPAILPERQTRRIRRKFLTAPASCHPCFVHKYRVQDRIRNVKRIFLRTYPCNPRHHLSYSTYDVRRNPRPVRRGSRCA